MSHFEDGAEQSESKTDLDMVDDETTKAEVIEIGKSAKKSFDALRRVLLMELKIIRQLVSQ